METPVSDGRRQLRLGESRLYILFSWCRLNHSRPVDLCLHPNNTAPLGLETPSRTTGGAQTWGETRQQLTIAPIPH